MAKIGVKYPTFKPNNADHGVVLGKANKVDLNLTMASGELAGDDAIAEKYSEFGSGQIALESTNISDENAVLVYGHKSTNGRVVCNAGDSAPEGRFAYYRTIMVNGVKKFKAFGYHRTRAQLGNESDQTKGTSITFATDSLTLDVMALDNGDWREYETYDDEADAIEFVNTFCAIESASDSSDSSDSSDGE